ncbi:hypothetical protein Q6D67_08950 [Haliea sp. E1-2-M8]|uniref:hypothetical protein n=1 Tax=Haliea sp. E1-2-M8 TaxID=3064706 RepID=UPI0027207259|nr:hypothetical protein [Haliea sp. E1-2-M8]MDO8861829.1 hypothetical protein [Haliea sp. E1-2-M8]
MRPWLRCLLLATLLPVLCARAEIPGFVGGHAKLQGTAMEGSDLDRGAELRLRWQQRAGGWEAAADYQLLTRHREASALPLAGGAGQSALPDDGRRWWDLSHEIDRSEDSLTLQRLDRLHIGYSSERVVLRLGRQAVSWGNGLLFNPVDVFNPFDPTAIDTEYKTGDDMLYGQYLLSSGSDFQLVQVQRRDEQGRVTSAASSTALKFHGFGLEREYDLMLAQHFDELLFALGASTNLGDAVLRGDVLFADSAQGWVSSAVVNAAWSWAWGGRNMSGVLEYFFNGHGLREAEYSFAALTREEALRARLQRGELFTLGRHYLAASLLVEMTPLLQLTPTLFANLGDGSALAQLSLRWDIRQDWQLLGALNLPLGPAGTEYGGIRAGEDKDLATGPALFAQLAWYF